LRYAYNTNGLAHHRLEDAFALVSELGYHGVALTLDHMHLDPVSATAAEVGRVARELQRRGLAVTVETGARFVLDPRRKHRPSLVEKDPLARMRRVEMLRRSVEIARDLEAEVVVLATGPADPDVEANVARGFLADGLRAILETAEACEVAVALEPEPGHFVDSLARWDEARELATTTFGLALDVSHLAAGESAPDVARARAGDLLAVHVEDCRPGVHEHLPFGEGSFALAPFLRALEDARYAGLVAVELSRHSHAGPDVAAKAIEALRAASR
jgi:sugar phosphate isomerase/epimerase